MAKKEIAEILSRRLTNSFDLSKICFKEQLAFINDTSRWVTASCSRRAGKTEVCALDLLNTAIKNPNTVSLYITLTRANAEKIVWAKLLAINEEYKLGGAINISKMSITFANKSVIYLSGCKDKSELDKFRGLALKLVYIDEVQSFKNIIYELIDQVIGPALGDHFGSLKLIGTPAALPSGFFWEALQNPVYSHHHWTFWDNPYIIAKAGKSHKEIIDSELARRGVSIDHPSVRREWFGEWTVDSEALVFMYKQSKNHYDNIAYDLTDFVIGVDVGFNDADAIAVIGWNKHQKVAYLVEESIKAQQGTTELTAEIARLIDRYDPLKVVMDTGGLGRKIAEEMRKRSQLPIQAAEKTRKIEYIELLNDALRTKRFMAKSNSRFAQDSNIVEWDYSKSTPDKKVIKDEPHSDICDAVLYAFRESLHWLSEPEKKKVDLRTQWLEHTTKLMEEHLEKQIEAQQAEERNNDAEALMQLDPFTDNPMQYYLNKRKH